MKGVVIMAVLISLGAVSCVGVPAADNAGNTNDASVPAAGETPDQAVPIENLGIAFSKGVNLSGWFQYVASPNAIAFGSFTKDDFANIKSLGADVIRLPIDFYGLSSREPNYTFEPLFFELLDQIVGWAEDLGIYLILDNHSSDGSNGQTPDNIDTVLIPLWTQVASHFKDSSNYILYEIMNEPYGISSKRWGEVQGKLIDTIRSIDTKHTLIVGGTSWNSIDALSVLPQYSDTNLLYTFHFYEPFRFTHQGATWSSAEVKNLKNIPFKADANSVNILAKALDKVVNFSQTRNVPVYCGEFGVYMKNSQDEDRVRWYKTVSGLLDERRIVRTNWDYFGGFGLFKTEAGGDFYTDLNLGVVRALGFTPPTQRPLKPIDSAFSIFDDSAANGITTNSWDCSVDYFSTPAADGKYALKWGKANQYGALTFTFTRPVSWNALQEQGYALSFKAKAAETTQFDIRFVDAEDADGSPWRLRATISLPGGDWQTFKIPLASMNEHGAWLNATQEWLNPEGKFSWDRVESLQIDAESGPIPGFIELDSLEITK
ncbi:MAG: glycoside hydrolase family 5 protein [Spirochaetaceae bacterium]|jgi:endoglucanase|nr:glycoside hydrolase family 5 protein [Spirochaetaceae bacterium]